MSINTRNQFVAAAKSITAVINGQTLGGQVKLFSTGSCGWYVNGKIDAVLSAGPMTVVIAGTPLQADFREFSSGNRGWYLAGKVMVPVAGGEMVRCQVSASLTMVGSKNGATHGKVQCGINVIAIGSKTWEYGPEVVMTPEQVAAETQRLQDMADQYMDGIDDRDDTDSDVSPVVAANNATPVQPTTPNLMDAFMNTTPVVAPAAPVNVWDALYTPTKLPKVIIHYPPQYNAQGQQVARNGRLMCACGKFADKTGKCKKCQPAATTKVA